MFSIGIAGFGGAGIALFDHFSAITDCEIKIIFDTENSAKERALKKSSKIIFTNDFNTFLNSGIDIVVISTPDKTHANYILQSLEFGKHILCEKPLTDSLSGIKNILKAAAAKPNLVFAVQHQMRFLPLHIKIKELIDKGELGRITYIEGYYVHNLTERAKAYHNWRFVDNATPLIYSGIHFVDILRWLTGDEIIEVSGMANNIAFPEYPESDLNVNLFKFKSGAIGKVITAFGAPRPQDHSIQIYGTKKCIKDNLLFSKDGSFEIIAGPLKNKLKKRKLGWLKNFTIQSYAKIFDFLMHTYPKNINYGVQGYPIRLYEHNLAVRHSVENFMEAVRGNGKPLCTVYEAARSVSVALAGVEAYRTGTTVKTEDYWNIT
jgi:predicted dehydrogenase